MPDIVQTPAAEYPIPLESPLEVSRDNTVVPSSAPTFLSKPMAPYNGLLGNSAKFEDEGWFVDWKRVFFEYGSGIKPEGLTELVAYNNGVYYMVLDTGKSVWFTPNSSTARRVGDVLYKDIKVSGTTYTVELDANTFEILKGINDGNIVLNLGVDSKRDQITLYFNSFNPVDASGLWTNRFTVQMPSFQFMYKGSPFTYLADTGYFSQSGSTLTYGKDPDKKSLQITGSTVGPSDTYKKVGSDYFIATYSSYMKFNIKLERTLILSEMTNVIDNISTEVVSSTTVPSIKVFNKYVSNDGSALLFTFGLANSSSASQVLLVASSGVFYNEVISDVTAIVRRFPEWGGIAAAQLALRNTAISKINVGAFVNGVSNVSVVTTRNITFNLHKNDVYEMRATTKMLYNMKTLFNSDVLNRDNNSTASTVKNMILWDEIDVSIALSFPSLPVYENSVFFYPTANGGNVTYTLKNIDMITPLSVAVTKNGSNNFDIEIKSDMRVWNKIEVQMSPLTILDRKGTYSSVSIASAEITSRNNGVMTLNNGMSFTCDASIWNILGTTYSLDYNGNILSPYVAAGLSETFSALGTFAASEPLVYGGWRDISYARIVTIDGKDYQISKDYSSAYRWYSEDIRNRTTSLLRTYKEGEYTICNSVWANEREKDVWVIDDQTVITIGYIDRITMYKKTGKKDIFKTYEWKEVASRPLSDFGFFKRFGISNAINNVPYIWEFDYDASNLIIRYREAPTSNLNSIGSPYTVRLPIPSSAGTSIGASFAQLAPCYSPEELWNLSRVSASRIGSALWFGIACDKAVKQWTVKCSGSSYSVVTGFGHVGIDGTLTGGVFPSIFCGTSGASFSTSTVDSTTPKSPTGDKVVSTTNDVLMYGNNVIFNNGTITFACDFTRLVIGIEKGTSLITVPAYQSRRDYGNNEAKAAEDGENGKFDLMNEELPGGVGGSIHEETETTHDHGFIWKNYYPTSSRTEFDGNMAWVNTYAWAQAEIVSSSWKVQNDVGKSEPERVVFSHAYAKLMSTNSPYYLLMATMSSEAGGSGVNFAGGIPGLAAGETAGDMSTAEQDTMTNFSNRLSSDSGMQKVYIRLSDFYSIGQGAHYYPGPGFIQVQMAKQAALCGAFTGVAKAEKSGKGKAKGYYSGFISAWNLIYDNKYYDTFEDRQVSETDATFSTGQYQTTLSHIIPYRKYGYNHRYINYPTKNVVSHKLTDFTVDIVANQVVKALGETALISRTGKKLEVGIAEAKASSITSTLNDRISIVEGSNMDQSAINKAKRSYKGNDNPQFSAPFVYDYCVYKDNEIYYSAIDSEIVAVSIKDTKVLDGPPSNVVIRNGNTYIGSPYCALEILKPSQYNLDLIRPRATTPQTLLLNCTGINCIHNDRIYHACDAYSNRITSGMGITGNDIEIQNSISTYRADDDFKVSSIFPPASMFGRFSSMFSVAYEHQIEHDTPFYKSLRASAEDKNLFRYSIPVIHNRLALLPAVMKTLAAYKLLVIEGVTSLCTELRSTTERARRPDALDFGIYGQVYRWNPEYISEIINSMGAQSIRDLVATIGLQYIGSTPDVAWFYSRAIRAFYNFRPRTVKRIINSDRFKSLNTGVFDFVERETVFDAQTDQGLVIARNNESIFTGTIYEPNATIGPYEFYSMAGGLVFQGNRRFQVNRFLITDDMVGDVKRNAPRWTKIKGDLIDNFWSKRNYGWAFNFNAPPSGAVKGWYLEPFTLATSFIGVDDYSESKFEWLINLAISDIMLSILGDKYVTLHIATETMTVGGTIRSPVSKLRIHKEMFVRQGQYGYYSYKFNGNNGIGDSERLYLWSDGPLLLRSLKQLSTSKTKKRTSPMETYAEAQGKEEW